MALKAGLFKAAARFLHLTSVTEEYAPRVVHSHAGPFGRTVYVLRDDIVLKNKIFPNGATARAITDRATGHVYISHSVATGGMAGYKTTLRHETVHVALSRNRVLAYTTATLYSHSHLFRYLEETVAETYGTRSLQKGHRLSLRYVNRVRFMAELGVVAAPIGTGAGLMLANGQDQ